MYLQEILEVVIGLVFLWLVISLATMSFQEWIANAINLRGNTLQKAIAQMLNSKDMLRKFYEYPLIANLYPLPKKPGRKARLPSHIPADRFSSSMFALIIQAGVDNSPLQSRTAEVEKKIVSIESPEQRKLAKDDWNAILEMAGNVSATGLGSAARDSLKFQVKAFEEKFPELKQTIDQLIPQMDSYYDQLFKLHASVSEPGTDPDLTMRQFRLGSLALQKENPRLGEAIAAILRQADGYTLRGDQAIATTRVNMETWFNGAMDRLSSDYKHKAQTVAFIIGLFLALLFNMDSIYTAASLWREPILRQAIIAQIQLPSQPAGIQDGQNTFPLLSIPAMEIQLQALNIPFGWTTAPFKTGERQCSLLPFKPGQVWGFPSWDGQGMPICKGLANLPRDLYGWLVKILGMLVTSAAAAQGAPFWFDILKKMVNIRSTGINPIDQLPVG
jgi:hypothetical protein